jgi:proline iminopeptidase
MSQDPANALFPPIEPFHHGFLPTTDGHRVYFEQCGHLSGLPVVFLHGGPGSGCSSKHRQLFNPSNTHVVLFDQRGCGRSTADHPLTCNHTQALVQDIERLRLQLKIDQWLVVGGSWGAGLALAYASAHPNACLGLVLRGIFLSRQSDLDWFFQEAQSVMPDAWAAFAALVPSPQRHAIANFMYEQIHHAEEAVALPLAQAWQAWENALTTRSFVGSAAPALSAADSQALLRKYRLQSHYLKHHCFFPETGLLSQLSTLASMPVHLLHGRLDWICRPEAAWAVHQVLPHSQLQWIDNAGHNAFEPEMTTALLQAIAAATQAHL